MIRHSPVLLMTIVAATLAACHEEDAPVGYDWQATHTSANYDIAADSNRAFSDRRSMALLCDTAETGSLRRLLLQRIPKGWYKTATNDARVLATVGDEGTAYALEEMYSKLPDKREDAESMAVLLHTAVATIYNRLGMHAAQTAADPLAALPQRREAIARLTRAERSQWQAALLDRIPGKWDANTGNDLALLGDFADLGAAGKLESIYRTPDLSDTSALTTTMMDAVKNIRARGQGN